MENIIYWAYYFLLAIFFIGYGFYHKSTREVLVYLQNNHKEKLTKWGLSPNFNPKGVSFGDTNRMSKFFKSPEYFNDEQVKKMKKKAILYNRIGKIAFILMIAVTVISYAFLRK